MPAPPTPLSLATRGDLYARLGAMETAGLPPEKAFSLLKFDARVQPRVEMARKLLAKGQDPAQAGEKSGLFNKLEARLVRAALAAGSPARVYRRLGDLYTQRAMQLASMKAKLWLPGFVLVVGLLTGPLPGLVTGSLGIGGYLWKVISPLLVIGALVWAGLRLPRWVRDSALEESVDTLLPRIPLFGRMHVRRNARDFFESLALMLEAGLPMLDALPLAVDTVSNTRMRRRFEALHAALEGGATFAQALHLVPQVGDARVLAFAQTGEASGTLPEMLFRHVEMESADLARFHAQVAAWTPRVVYALVAIWMASGIFSGPGLMSQLPPDLR
jgi:general secretion pathway protein F